MTCTHDHKTRDETGSPLVRIYLALGSVFLQSQLIFWMICVVCMYDSALFFVPFLFRKTCQDKTVSFLTKMPLLWAENARDVGT